MSRDGIPVNIWDDYWDDDIGRPQETSAYVEDSDVPERERNRMLKVVFDALLLLDLKGVSIRLIGDNLLFSGLTHARRERLVKELKSAKLEFEGKPFNFYSES